MTKEETVRELCDMLNVSFNRSAFPFKSEVVKEIVRTLKEYERPDDFVLIGERPPTPQGNFDSSEGKSRFREKMVRYIRENTGLEIPYSPSAPVKFYSSCADFLEL